MKMDISFRGISTPSGHGKPVCYIREMDRALINSYIRFIDNAANIDKCLFLVSDNIKEM